MTYLKHGLISAMPEEMIQMSRRDILEFSAVPLLLLENIGGLVYIARGEGQWRALHKIGRTVNLPQRAKALNKRFDTDLRFSHAIWTDDPEWLERQFHLLFASWHYAMPTGSGTEWFELSWPHIRWARQIEAINSDYMRSFIENRDHILELNMAYAPALLSGMGRFNG